MYIWMARLFISFRHFSVTNLAEQGYMLPWGSYQVVEKQYFLSACNIGGCGCRRKIKIFYNVRNRIYRRAGSGRF